MTSRGEEQWSALFRDAAGDPPPPTFSADDVAAASARLRARRRAMVAAVSACVVLLFGVAGVVGLVVTADRGGEGASTALAPGDAKSGQERQPGAGQARPPSAPPNFPAPTPMQGGEGSGENGPRAGTSGCEKVDRELAIALAGELPATDPDRAISGGFCDVGRSAAFEVNDSQGSGTVAVTLLPPNYSVALKAPPGVVRVSEPAASGGTIVLLSSPLPGRTDAPARADLDRIAKAIAARF